MFAGMFSPHLSVAQCTSLSLILFVCFLPIVHLFFHTPLSSAADLFTSATFCCRCASCIACPVDHSPRHPHSGPFTYPVVLVVVARQQLPPAKCRGQARKASANCISAKLAVECQEPFRGTGISASVPYNSLV